jgi:N-acetylneuraminic acid mutarotase
LLYVIAGYGQVGDGPGLPGGELKSHIEIYDPATDRWSTGAPLPTALAHGRACVFGNQIYVFGGSSVAGWERSIFTYNTTSNSWSAKSPMPNTRYTFECVTVDSAAYLVGGFGLAGGGGSINGTVERYDPFVETWSSPTRMQTPRYSLSVAVVGRRVFTIGGMARSTGDRAVDVVEILDIGRL